MTILLDYQMTYKYKSFTDNLHLQLDLELLWLDDLENLTSQIGEWMIQDVFMNRINIEKSTREPCQRTAYVHIFS